MQYLDRMYIAASIKAAAFRDKMIAGIKDFYDSEDGVSNVVATIIILLIVVILIGVFWDRLSEWISGIMDQIFGSDIPSKGDLGG